MFWRSFACTHRPWPPCPFRGHRNSEPTATGRLSADLAQVYQEHTVLYKHRKRRRVPSRVSSPGGSRGVRQLADQHLPIQPRALPRLIQQPRLVLFICVPILLLNAFQIAPVSAGPSSAKTGRAALALSVIFLNGPTGGPIVIF